MTLPCVRCDGSEIMYRLWQMRDVRMVGNKIGYVIWPRPDSMKELSRNCNTVPPD